MSTMRAVVIGGAGFIGSHLIDALLPLVVGVPDAFPTQYGSQQTMLSHWGLTAEKLAERMRLARRKA
jgi:nucleoside-diphosphate-sugar epimerase